MIKRILPQFQHLVVGDKIFFGQDELTVAALEPCRAPVLSNKGHGMEWVWQFGLYPLDNKRTRLVNRGIERIPNKCACVDRHACHGASCIHHDAAHVGREERAEALRDQRAARAGDTGSDRTAA